MRNFPRAGRNAREPFLSVTLSTMVFADTLECGLGNQRNCKYSHIYKGIRSETEQAASPSGVTGRLIREYKHRINTLSTVSLLSLSLSLSLSLCLCQSVIHSVIECRLDYTTQPLSLSSLFKHNSDIMKPWESLPEQQKDTPLQTRRCPLDLPTMVTRQKMKQVKA